MSTFSSTWEWTGQRSNRSEVTIEKPHLGSRQSLPCVFLHPTFIFDQIYPTVHTHIPHLLCSGVYNVIHDLWCYYCVTSSNSRLPVLRPRDNSISTYQNYPHLPTKTSSQLQNCGIPSVTSFPSRIPVATEAEALGTNTVTPVTSKSRKEHLCIYCGKFFSRKYGLKIHQRTHTGFKPLQCKVCLRSFGDPSNLNKHVRLHAEDYTPYSCGLCGKVLVRRRDLDRHIESRHPNEPGRKPDVDV